MPSSVAARLLLVRPSEVNGKSGAAGGGDVSLWRLVLREIAYRKGSSLLGLCAVTVAVGSTVGAVLLLRCHDLQTRAILQRKEDSTRQRLAELDRTVADAMDRLGFNIMILPAAQDLG